MVLFDIFDMLDRVVVVVIVVGETAPAPESALTKTTPTSRQPHQITKTLLPLPIPIFS